MTNWSKSRSVPVVCSAVSSALIAHVESSKRASPVWSLRTFYELCQKNHQSLQNSSPEILFSVASYLHDVGRIIILPECSGSKNDKPLVIVDPNWRTETFLGAVIAEGNDFDVQGGSRSGSVSTTSSDGFIDERGFQSLLQTILEQMKLQGIRRSLLEELLQRLDLCYKLEDDASVRNFVVCWIRELGNFSGMMVTLRDLSMSDRLHCKDTERTSFTKAFFSRFQISFRQKLMQRFGIKESSGGISCGLGLLRD
ncbi:hypothetical protein R1sor_026093 [Riccia sorocarpa]|uniref:HD domain-containing protein n=1 Tax=Riccia sorocarpa TaxID=122646 RepID=A0ABD3GDH5_9MARC